MVLGGFGPFWVVLGHFGWFLVVLCRFGSFWVVLGGFLGPSKFLLFSLRNFPAGQKFSYVYACGDFLEPSKYCIFSVLNFPVGKNPRMCTRAWISFYLFDF